MRVRLIMALTLLPLLVAARPPADPAERAADAADKVICKRFTKTGSLVATQRVCKTKADWERDREGLARRLSTSDGCRLSGAGVGCPL